MAPSRAGLPTEVDDLQVEGVPAVLGEEDLEVTFGPSDVGAVRETPTRGQAVDVGVDRKGGNAEGLELPWKIPLTEHSGSDLELYHKCKLGSLSMQKWQLTHT